MRILFLAHSFNSLTQRLYLELTERGHEVAVEFDIDDAVTIEAVALYRPDIVVAPFLKRAIPEAVWRRHVCLVVHPGVPGDRGPSSLDWAIAEGEAEWGVTVLQAEHEMDAGPVWGSASFRMRDATKSSLYRNEVTDAAVRALLAALQAFAAGGVSVQAGPGRGGWRPLLRQAERRIDWQQDDTAAVLRKIRAADGQPGVLDTLFGVPCHLFDAHAEKSDSTLPPGTPIGRHHEAVLLRTVDGAVWIGHVKRVDRPDGFKLPTAEAFPQEVAALPLHAASAESPAAAAGWNDIRYETHGPIGLLHFPFYNGAFSTAQCQRLTAAVAEALKRPERVLVLAGGPDFWCNGIQLNVIEAARSPADESLRNIEAMNELTRTLIEADDRFVIAAMQGNAGAGGVFMALAADRVWARSGVVLNPHYKNMGNLYGSEYWTYLLPRRPLTVTPAQVMAHRLPVSARQAAAVGLIDEVIDARGDDFVRQVQERALALAAGSPPEELLRAKRERRARDESLKPLARYRAEELARMHRNFYGFDPSYHIARSNFVRRVAHSWTPRHLALHRELRRPGNPDSDQESAPGTAE